ncbi:MAG TPA: hypothetical protein PLS95_02625 [Thermoanaerobaculales bacterium]|nr:hypothetical protein [Thermoanaerobaculales bacterium]
MSDHPAAVGTGRLTDQLKELAHSALEQVARAIKVQLALESSPGGCRPPRRVIDRRDHMPSCL